MAEVSLTQQNDMDNLFNSYKHYEDKEKAYYDDFDPAKNYLKNMYNPGRAPQSRELIQNQTFLQHQLSRTAESYIKNGSYVSGINLSFNLVQTAIDAREMKDASGEDISISFLRGKTFTGEESGRSIKIRDTISDETIIVDYYGGDIVETELFVSDDENPEDRISFKFSGSFYTILETFNQTGIVFANGYFVHVPSQRRFSKNWEDVNINIGFLFHEKIVTYEEDWGLRENNRESTNFTAIGADRYKIDLELVALTDDELQDPEVSKKFISGIIIRNGELLVSEKAQISQELLDILAKRTYDESGSYSVVPWKTVLKDLENPYQYTASLQPGRGYIYGYPVENRKSANFRVARPYDSIEFQRMAAAIDTGFYTFALQHSLVPDGNFLFEFTVAEPIVLMDGPDGTGDILGECLCTGYGIMDFELVIFLSETGQIANLFTAGKSFISKADPTRYMNLKLSGESRAYFNGTYKTQIVETGINNVDELDLATIEYDFLKEFTENAAGGIITLLRTHEFDSFEHGSVVAIQNVETLQFIDPSAFFYSITDEAVSITSEHFVNGTYKIFIRVHVTGVDAIKTPFTEAVEFTFPSKDSGLQEDKIDLGHEDIFSFLTVVQKTNTASGEPVDVSEHLTYDGGQRDEFYEFGSVSGFLSAIPESLRADDGLETVYEISYRWFEHSGYGPFTANSYKNLKPLYTNSFLDVYEPLEDGSTQTVFELKFPCYLNQENFAVFKSGLLLTPGVHYDRLDADGNVVELTYDPEGYNFPEITHIRTTAPNATGSRISILYFKSPSTMPVKTFTVGTETDNLVLDVPEPVAQDQENFLVFKDGLLLIPGLNYDRLNEFDQLLPTTFTPGLPWYPSIHKIRLTYTVQAGAKITFLKVLSKQRSFPVLLKHEILDVDMENFEIDLIEHVTLKDENFIVFRDGMLLNPFENYDRVTGTEEVLPKDFELGIDGEKTITKLRFSYPMPKYSEIALVRCDFNTASLLDKDVVAWEYDYLYKSNVTGTIYYLKDCLDFRRRHSALVTNYLFPYPGSVEFSGKYYLPRIDLVYAHKSGKFGYKYGIPADPPSTPEIPSGSMPLSLVYNLAVNENKQAVFVVEVENQRYTMEDIGQIDTTISNLAYAVALRRLEISVLKNSILDEDGYEFLKTGIFTDNFYNFNGSDYTNPEFSATIDEYEYSMRPAINATKIDFTYMGSESDTKAIKNTVTMDWTIKEWISQKKRSSTINIQEYMFYVWQGHIDLTPTVDTWVEDRGEILASQIYIETEMPPTIVAVGTYSVVTDTEIKDVSDTTKNLISRPAGGNWIYEVYEKTTTTVADVTRDTYRTDEHRTYEDSGFAIDSRTSVDRSRAAEVMRQRDVAYHATGLRAGVAHNGFLDGQQVVLSNDTPNSVGVLDGQFTVPFGIPVGTKLFTLADKDLTSTATAEYTATGTIIWKDITEQYIRVWTLTSAVRQDEYVGTTITEETSVEVSQYDISFQYDPIVQSFYVNEENGIYLHSIDVFFAQKDPSVNVEMVILEMENGYPSTRALPFGTVSKTSAEVNVSEDGAAAVPTKFTFSDPVYLYGQTEYGIMLKTTSYKYLVWRSVMGEKDLETDITIQEQPYIGSLFMSQNATTWTADQSSDLSFIAYRYDFASEGSAYFEIYNPEDNLEVAFNSLVMNSFAPAGTTVKYLYAWGDDPDWIEYTNETTIRYSSLKNIWKYDSVEYTGRAAIMLRIRMESSDPHVSPQIDLEKNLGVFYNNVLKETKDQDFPWYGGAYITNPLNLNYDSENLRVYVNEILPNMSKIDFFVKYNDYTPMFTTQSQDTSGLFGWNTDGPQALAGTRAQIYHYNSVEKRLEPRSELIVTKYDPENSRVYIRSVGDINDLKSVVTGYSDIYQDLDEDYTAVAILGYLSDANILADAYVETETYEAGRFCFYGGDVWQALSQASPGYIPYTGSPIWQKIISVKATSKGTVEQDQTWRKLVGEQTSKVSVNSAGVSFYEYMYKPETNDFVEFKLMTLKAEFHARDKVNMPRMKDLRIVSLA
jgi:hypothetical protein